MSNGCTSKLACLPQMVRDYIESLTGRGTSNDEVTIKPEVRADRSRLSIWTRGAGGENRTRTVSLAI
jgi:hypothetical protein